MLIEKIDSEGLARLSYVVGHGGQGAVVGPCRDHRIYRDAAARRDPDHAHLPNVAQRR